jgi:hypothetical protein
MLNGFKIKLSARKSFLSTFFYNAFFEEVKHTMSWVRQLSMSVNAGKSYYLNNVRSEQAFQDNDTEVDFTLTAFK